MGSYQTIGKGEVICGGTTTFGEGVKFIFKKPGMISIGDYVTIGDGVKIVLEGGKVAIDDWSMVHANTLILSTKGVDIGQHCWFGQNSIIDGTGGLVIENGVRVGMYSQIWTHVAAGEQIEGCTLFSANPVHIASDVWLVGSCTVGSGIRIGRRAICLNGSNVTRSVADGMVVAGAPARPREGLKFYREISIDEKYAMMESWVQEFCEDSDGNFSVYDSVSNCINIKSISGEEAFVFKFSSDYDECCLKNGQSKFCIENKKYSKSFTDIESKLMRYLSGNKARFLR